MENLQSGGQISSGSISLYISQDCDDFNPCMLFEGGSASFYRSSFFSSQLGPGLPSPGSCLTLPPQAIPAGVARPTFLDAGSVLTVSGPKGSKQMLLNQLGLYGTTFASGTGPAQFLEPGNYVVDNGPGGLDVGPFRANLTIPKQFTSSVQRTPAAVKVVWSGGDPSGIVILQGIGPRAANGSTVRFRCTERVAAGQFTIPAEVLLSLPPDTPDHSGVTVSATSPVVTMFRAPGIDLGQLTFTSP